MLKQIESDLSVRSELVPEIFGERCIYSFKDGDKMGFEISDCRFGGIVPSGTLWYTLI